MNIFVSGATGFIGQRLVLRLAEQGHTVHALYRNESKTRAIQHPNIILYKGDLLNRESMIAAMANCRQAYHVGAFAGVWAKDEQLIHRLNVDATLVLIDCARQAGIERVVVTSTAGILGPSRGEEVNEDSPPPPAYFTPYESSKALMEEAIGKLTSPAPEVIIVNPTRVYGPGELSESNGVTRMIRQYLDGKWHLVPGNGNQSGNYVFVEDVVDGHILAMAKGQSRERYVLGGENITYNELFRIVRDLSGKKYRLFHMPVWLMLFAAGAMQMLSRLTGNPPLIVPDLVRKFNHQWRVSSLKAGKVLGYSPRSARDGISRTLEWLRES